MAIEIIDTLGQKNNGDFPLVDSNDIKGGYYQVSSIEERDNIPSIRRKIGMKCYVEENDSIYMLKSTLDNSGWEVDNSNSGSETSGECFYEGNEPPEDINLIWFDTTDKSIDEKLDSIIIQEMKSIISAMSAEITYLKEKVEYLWNNQGNGGTLPSEGDCITMEDGNYLLLEDGSRILLETSISEETANILAADNINFYKGGKNGRY